MGWGEDLVCGVHLSLIQTICPLVQLITLLPWNSGHGKLNFQLSILQTLNVFNC